MFDNKNRFVIENYNKQSCFASFLPGISGIHGTPLWNFYVNRGQAICSFGSENKDHSIMEFYPAHQSYQFTKTMGFRTFLKVDGTFYEPFVDDDMPHKMYIGMNELEIEEGKLTGRYVGEVVDGRRKAELLRLLCQFEEINIAQSVAVGDGANDLPMLNLAGLGIAFHAKPKVKATARQSISTIGLDGILYFLGLKDSRIEA